MDINHQRLHSDMRDFGAELLNRIADKADGKLASSGLVDPSKLRIYFERSINELQNARAQLQAESLRLEKKCREENAAFISDISQLSDRITEANKSFKDLDTNLNEVSGKIIHLGDQLERKNAPRESLREARRQILEFSKFLGAGGGTFANISVNSQADEGLLIDKAANIRSLSALCLELPDDERFLGAKQRITVASQNLENLLVKRFRYNFSAENDEMMRRIAEVLAFSKSHSGCADVFIEEMLKCLPQDLGDLSMLPDILAEAEAKIVRIFHRPENVVFHLIQTLFQQNLKAHLQSKVRVDMPSDEFLNNLYTEYCSLDRVVFQLLERLQLISDETQLYKLLNGLAEVFLQSYQFREISWLKIRLRGHLSAYYASLNHQKRNLGSTGFSELKNALTSRLQMASSSSVREDTAEQETLLLSQEVAVNMLDDVRQSAKRSLLLVHPVDRPQFGLKLYEVLTQYLVTEHIDYGITLALQSLNCVDPKSTNPRFTFFAAVNEGNALFNFFEKAVNEFIGPVFARSPTSLQECASRRQECQRNLEAKFSLGLARCLGLAVSRVQAILWADQRKTDYKGDAFSTNPTDPMNGLPSASTACQNVCKFIRLSIGEARKNLDGQNLVTILNELGLRFHRLLIDHFYGFSFSDTGGFVAMQDVTAYRDAAREFQSPKIDYLFDILLKLMNLILIKPQNVRQVWQDYEQSGIPKELMANFIQLRVDYKQRLQHEVKSYMER